MPRKEKVNYTPCYDLLSGEECGRLSRAVYLRSGFGLSSQVERWGVAVLGWQEHMGCESELESEFGRENRSRAFLPVPLWAW